MKWIHGPFVDLAFIAFQWLPLYAVYLTTVSSSAACDVQTRYVCPEPMLVVIALTVFLTRLHRHYSLAFVYGDGAELRRHRLVYTWAPVLLFVAVFPAALYQLLPGGTPRDVMFGLLVLVSSVSGTWNVYHVIMQKYGFLRIYSARLGYGDAALEKKLFLSWLAVVIVGSARAYTDDAIWYLSARGFGFVQSFVSLIRVASIGMLVPTVAYSAFATFRWITQERANFSRASVPKLVFAASVFLVLATFAHSLLLGMVLLGFSHAFEYAVFVNLYAKTKYEGQTGAVSPMAGWTRYASVSNVVLALIVYGLYEALDILSWPPWELVTAYALYSSMLHFLYDGLLWKMRDAAIRGHVLRIGQSGV
jgi:hypothetical protein